MEDRGKEQVCIVKKPVRAVVLCSGGIDSTVALYWAHKQHEVVAGISFDYGAKHRDKELPFAEFHCRKLKVPHQIVGLSFVRDLFSSALLQSGDAIPDGPYENDNMRQTVVPFRNGIMLAAAAGFAESIEATDLLIGAHAGDHEIYPDCRDDFMDSMNEAIKRGTYAQIEILRPLIAKTKAEIVTLGSELGVDFSQTWSCYKGGETHCGTCGTCIERREAFAIAKVPDPTLYEST